MREETGTYEISATHQGRWLDITVKVGDDCCGPWHQGGCDSHWVVRRLMLLVRGLTGVIRAACMTNEHTSLHLLVSFTEDIAPHELARKISAIVAGMFEYGRG